jgi:mRNA interferase RelE/StbE
MAYEVRGTKTFARQLARISPKSQRERIETAVDGLAIEPRPRQAEKLKGNWIPYWRLRVGEYRVLYEIDDDSRVVLVNRVNSRQVGY